MKKWIVVSVVAGIAFATMATQCQPVQQDVWGASIQQISTYADAPHSQIEADSSLVPSIGGPHAPEVCSGVPSNVAARRDICRVIYGAEQFGDYRDWLVAITLNGKTPQLPGPVSAYDGYGWTITTNEGTTFENCQNFQGASTLPGLVMRCDFMATNQFVAADGPTGGLQLSYLLDKMWNWGHYEVGQDLACAGSIATALKNPVTALITLQFLLDCSDLPYGG